MPPATRLNRLAHRLAHCLTHCPARLACWLIAATVSAAATAAPLRLEYLGQQILPTGTRFADTEVGGLSAIDHDPARGCYLALSDDRGNLQPARFYRLELDLNAFIRSSAPGHAGVTFTGVTTLRRADGSSYPAGSVDPEALRFDAARRLIYWASEGGRVPHNRRLPSIGAMGLDGDHRRDFSLPARFLPTGTIAGITPGDAGIRDNLGFESLALAVDGRTLYAATENALIQDGAEASLTQGSSVRMLAFDIESGQPVAEYLYPVAPVVLPPLLPGLLAMNSLADLLAIDSHRFIALERSFAVGAATPGTPTTGYSIRLFEVDIAGATDVAKLDSLVGAAVTPVAKRLLLDLSALNNDDGSPLALDNIEGIARGPVFQGRPTLILVGDNNFRAEEFTQFIALWVTGLGVTGLGAGVGVTGLEQQKPQ